MLSSIWTRIVKRIIFPVNIFELFVNLHKSFIKTENVFKSIVFAYVLFFSRCRIRIYFRESIQIRIRIRIILFGSVFSNMRMDRDQTKFFSRLVPKTWPDLENMTGFLKQDRFRKTWPDSENMNRSGKHDRIRKTWPDPENMAGSGKHDRIQKTWLDPENMTGSGKHDRIRKTWN